MILEKTLKQKYNTILDKYRLLQTEVDQQTLFYKSKNLYELEQVQKELDNTFKQIETISIYKPTNQDKQKGFSV